MSSITYKWRPSCTPRLYLPDFSAEETVHETHLKNSNYAAIVQNKDLFWTGARKIIDLNDPYQTQRKYGFSLQDPVEKIRILFEKNLAAKADFTLAIIGNDAHIHVKEDAKQITVNVEDDLHYSQASDGDGEAPTRVTTNLCPSKEQTLLKDFLPDFIVTCGATCSIIRENRDVYFTRSEVSSFKYTYKTQKVDIVHVAWNRS